MICNFTWYNLPNQIKKLIEPFENQLSKEVKNITWYNLPYKLNKLYKELVLIKPSCDLNPKFIWFSLNKKAEAICKLVDCLNMVGINFDVTSSNWGTIVDAQSFKTLLESRSSETTNTITNFSLVSGRLRCNITNVLQLNLYSLNITNVNIVSVAGMQYLDLSSNQIVTFNPTIALPTSLTTLFLNTNQIVTFNPTIALPASLINLILISNQIVTFNPTIALPTSLIGLYLDTNQMTTLGYTQSEPWANTQPPFTSVCDVYLNGNIDSSETTNLRTILISKNCNVIS